MKRQGWKSQFKGQREHHNHSPAHFPTHNGRCCRRTNASPLGFSPPASWRHGDHGWNAIFSFFVSDDFVSDVSDFVSADFVCFSLLLGVLVEVLQPRIIIFLV